MASITGKTNLFFVTSPRSPHKMRDEIRVLVENYTGQQWERNRPLQENFYRRLASEPFFTGTVTGELDFKARDRITRGPKAFGLVSLFPYIDLTEAGQAYVYGKRPSEAFTRQLLKFQLPSPFHIDKGKTYFVKPYLELLRLIDDLGTLSKDEIAAFVIQLVNFEKFDEVKKKIEAFRRNIAQLDRSKTNYKRYFNEVFSKEIAIIYAQQIHSGDVQIRESRTETTPEFTNTKKNNHKDYADAAIRYLRETHLVSLQSAHSSSVFIPNDKKAEVAFILQNVPREPVYIDDVVEFQSYLFSSSLPVLYTDNRDKLVDSILTLPPIQSRGQLMDLSIEELKDFKERLIEEKRKASVAAQINQLQLYEDYDDIVTTYQEILDKQVFDAPLIMEWNTWRAFVMLDDGEVIGNFRLDSTGVPLSTAPGNHADILCKYEDFDILVEVTLSSGKRQYETEGEPVARHLGEHQKQHKRDSFCIFIAHRLSPATLAHFYMLHKYDVAYYAGKARIIPLSLQNFQNMLEQAYHRQGKPTSSTIRSFVRTASQLALETENEEEWYEAIKQLTSNWV